MMNPADGQRLPARAPLARGLRDHLPVEAGDRRLMTRAALERLASWGYAEVATPAFERYDDLVSESGETVEAELFRFFDSDGALMALRPEMTTPIARLVGQRMPDEAGPIRLCYAATVFRDSPTLMGQAREYLQVGAELISTQGPVADAEVVALAADVAAAARAEDAVVALGRVDLIRAVLSAAGVLEHEASPLLKALGGGDIVTFSRMLAESAAVPVRARAATELVRLDGGPEVIDRARELAGPAGRPMLDELEQTLSLVEASLGRQCVRLAFGTVRAFDYYTGLVFDVFAPGLGTAIGGGGRYDRLLGEFGKPRAAAGFALGLERLQQAAAARGPFIERPLVDVVLSATGDPAGLARAAATLRAKGLKVRADFAGPAVVAPVATAQVPGEEPVEIDLQSFAEQWMPEERRLEGAGDKRPERGES